MCCRDLKPPAPIPPTALYPRNYRVVNPPGEVLDVNLNNVGPVVDTPVVNGETEFITYIGNEATDPVNTRVVILGHVQVVNEPGTTLAVSGGGGGGGSVLEHPNALDVYTRSDMRGSILDPKAVDGEQFVLWYWNRETSSTQPVLFQYRHNTSTPCSYTLCLSEL